MASSPFFTSKSNFSVKEVAEFLGKDPKTIRRWIKAGELRAMKLGRDWLISREDLKRFLKDRQNMDIADVL